MCIVLHLINHFYNISHLLTHNPWVSINLRPLEVTRLQIESILSQKIVCRCLHRPNKNKKTLKIHLDN